MSNAVPLLPNAMNTFRVFKPLALMASAEKAVHVKQRLGFFEVYVPSDLGGRLRVGFKDPAPDSNARLVVSASNGVEAKSTAETSYVEIEFEQGTRGDGICQVAVSAPEGSFSIYALFDEIGFARERDGSPLVPWNIWYFPFAHGLADQSAWGSIAVQPLVKYEQAFGPSKAMEWELEHHDDPHRNEAGWAGHCHNAAPASILFAAPPDAGLKRRGVEFSCEELKYYGAEYFPQHAFAESVWSLPKASFGIPDRRYRRLKPEADPALFGTEPCLGRFLKLLRERVRNEGHALVMDLGDPDGRSSIEVWNQAVYKYRARYYQNAPDDLDLVEVLMDLHANDESWLDGDPTGLPADITFTGTEWIATPNENGRDQRFRMQLRFNPDGKLIPWSADNLWRSLRRRVVLRHGGVTWKSVFAPRTMAVVKGLWRFDVPMPPAPPEMRGNPHIEAEHVMELLRLREKYR